MESENMIFFTTVHRKSAALKTRCSSWLLYWNVSTKSSMNLKQTKLSRVPFCFVFSFNPCHRWTCTAISGNLRGWSAHWCDEKLRGCLCPLSGGTEDVWRTCSSGHHWPPCQISRSIWRDEKAHQRGILISFFGCALILSCVYVCMFIYIFILFIY